MARIFIFSQNNHYFFVFRLKSKTSMMKGFVIVPKIVPLKREIILFYTHIVIHITLWFTMNVNYLFLCFSISGHFFASCMFIFHKTEIQMVILRCLTVLNLNWLKSYGLRCSKKQIFKFPFFCDIVQKHKFVFFCVFGCCIITFVPTKI